MPKQELIHVSGGRQKQSCALAYATTRFRSQSAPTHPTLAEFVLQSGFEVVLTSIFFV